MVNVVCKLQRIPRISSLEAEVLKLKLYLVNELSLFSDSSHLYNTELVQQKSGFNISLKCGLRDSRKKEIDLNRVHWHFKQCGEMTSRRSCDNASEVKWKRLFCNVKYCNSTLKIMNLSDANSGLYKCTIYPYKPDANTTINIKLVKIYHLHVKSRYFTNIFINTVDEIIIKMIIILDSTVTSPEFVDSNPLNKTVHANSKAVFQCRVQSLVYPALTWFKKLPDIKDELEYSIGSKSNFDSRMVKYQGSFYKRVDSDPPKAIAENIYLSKLILSEVTMENHGVYACVAINYIGLQIREVFLNVLPFEENFKDKEKSNRMEFMQLFLIPLGLVMVSLLTWLCYKTCFICYGF